MKSVWQCYAPNEQTLWLLEQFRQMLNDCIQIGLRENVTSLKSLSLKAYHPLAKYDVYSQYRLTAISAATGILRSYRKARRQGKDVKQPYAKRPQLVACYDFKIENGVLCLPLRAGQHVTIPLNPRILETAQGFMVRSVTLTPEMLCLAYARNVQEIQPQGFIGIDRNLDNVTAVASDGQIGRHDLSEATRTKATYREVRRHMTRNDHRVRRQVSGKYGRKQRDKVQQILHHASSMIIMEAKEKQFGIVMEKLTGIRRLYRRGNGQGRNYHARLNSWSFGELQRQIEYKARWLGLPVIYVSPYGTSSKCSICGQKMVPEENRMLRCPSCGYVVDRDMNAARNILARGVRFAPFAPALEAMVQEPIDQQVILKVDAGESKQRDQCPEDLTEPTEAPDERNQGFMVSSGSILRADERFEVGSLEELTKVARSFNQTAIYVSNADWGEELFSLRIVTCNSQSIVATEVGQCSQSRQSQIDYEMWDQAAWWELVGTIAMGLLAVIAFAAIREMRQKS